MEKWTCGARFYATLTVTRNSNYTRTNTGSTEQGDRKTHRPKETRSQEPSECNHLCPRAQTPCRLQRLFRLCKHAHRRLPGFVPCTNFLPVFRKKSTCCVCVLCLRKIRVDNRVFAGVPVCARVNVAGLFLYLFLYLLFYIWELYLRVVWVLLIHVKPLPRLHHTPCPTAKRWAIEWGRMSVTIIRKRNMQKLLFQCVSEGARHPPRCFSAQLLRIILLDSLWYSFYASLHTFSVIGTMTRNAGTMWDCCLFLLPFVVRGKKRKKRKKGRAS